MDTCRHYRACESNTQHCGTVACCARLIDGCIEHHYAHKLQDAGRKAGLTPDTVASTRVLSTSIECSFQSRCHSPAPPLSSGRGQYVWTAWQPLWPLPGPLTVMLPCPLCPYPLQYNTCFWALVKGGKTPPQAQETLKVGYGFRL